MGLFDSFKAKREEKKELKRQEEEAKKALGEALLQEAREFMAQGIKTAAVSKYQEACPYNVNAIIELLEIYRQDDKLEDYFALCQKYGSNWYLEWEIVPVAEALAECYRYGFGTAKNRPEAYKVMERCAKKRSLYDEASCGEAELFLSGCAQELYDDCVKIKSYFLLRDKPE